MNDTIGIILAGGMGSRMLPLTRAISKHLLPVQGHAMLHWPIETLARLGIEKAVVVVGGRSAGAIVEHFGPFHDTRFGRVHLRYAYQPEAGGIPDAMRYAGEAFEGFERVVVVLGDNMFSGDLDPIRDALVNSPLDQAIVVAKPAATMRGPASSYGCVPEIAGRLLPHFVEKPKGSPSEVFPGILDDACTWAALLGLYVFPSPDVFFRTFRLRPSDRGELEVVDLISSYSDDDRLTLVRYVGDWIDAGGHDEYLAANRMDLS